MIRLSEVTLDEKNLKIAERSEAYITIKDLLGTSGPITIGNVSIDAMIDLKVVRTMDDEFLVEECSIAHNAVYFQADLDSPKCVFVHIDDINSAYYNYYRFLFEALVDEMAVEAAKKSDPVFWQWSLVDGE